MCEKYKKLYKKAVTLSKFGTDSEIYKFMSTLISKLVILEDQLETNSNKKLFEQKLIDIKKQEKEKFNKKLETLQKQIIELTKENLLLKKNTTFNNKNEIKFENLNKKLTIENKKLKTKLKNNFEHNISKQINKLSENNSNFVGVYSMLLKNNNNIFTVIDNLMNKNKELRKTIININKQNFEQFKLLLKTQQHNHSLVKNIEKEFLDIIKKHSQQQENEFLRLFLKIKNDKDYCIIETINYIISRAIFYKKELLKIKNN